MKLKKVLSICKANGFYYLYDRIDRSGEITQWLGDGYALYPLDGLPILDEESFCAVFDITGKQREKILFRHERLPEHLNVEDVAARPARADFAFTNLRFHVIMLVNHHFTP